MTFNQIVIALWAAFLVGWLGGGYLGYQMGKLRGEITGARAALGDPKQKGTI